MSLTHCPDWSSGHKVGASDRPRCQPVLQVGLFSSSRKTVISFIPRLAEINK